MSKDEIEYRFPWVPALLMVLVFIIPAVMEYFNWTPFW